MLMCAKYWKSPWILQYISPVCKPQLTNIRRHINLSLCFDLVCSIETLNEAHSVQKLNLSLCRFWRHSIKKRGGRKKQNKTKTNSKKKNGDSRTDEEAGEAGEARADAAPQKRRMRRRQRHTATTVNSSSSAAVQTRPRTSGCDVRPTRQPRASSSSDASGRPASAEGSAHSTGQTRSTVCATGKKKK